MYVSCRCPSCKQSHPAGAVQSAAINFLALGVVQELEEKERSLAAQAQQLSRDVKVGADQHCENCGKCTLLLRLDCAFR